MSAAAEALAGAGVKPKQFDGLAGFTAKCERAVAVDPDALVLFAHTRRLKVERLRVARVGPEARVIGWDAEQCVTVLEVPASEMLTAIGAGLFYDRHASAPALALSLALAQAIAGEGEG